MPRSGWVAPIREERLPDYVSIGVLTRVFPPDLVDSVVERCGRRERRSRLLPARLVVYFVLGLALFSSDAYQDVIRSLTAGLAWLSRWRTPWTPPSKVALYHARRRLGSHVIQELFNEVAGVVSAESGPAGLTMVAVDATTVNLPDTVENVAVFGRPGAKLGQQAGFPQARIVGLADCEAHTVFAAAIAPYGEGEQTVFRRLISRLDTSMLLVADRGFFSYALWRDAVATGASLCWRMKSHHVLPELTRFSDGSYQSRIYPDATARRRNLKGIDVRVVEYRVGDGDEVIRLATSILDPSLANANDLVAAYRTRWQIESSFDELKTHQGHPDLVLRSKSPALVEQEIWAYLCVHHAIRKLLVGIVIDAGHPPQAGSFTTALRSARRSVIITANNFSPSTTKDESDPVHR